MSCITCKTTGDSDMAAVKKDDMFWNALMNHKVKKRLGFFRRKPKLDNVPGLALKYSISEEDVKKVHSIFIAMDDDSSGTISSTEVATMLMGFGCDVSPKVVQAVMRTSDVNGDGEINFEEFLCAVTSKIKNALAGTSEEPSRRTELSPIPEITVSGEETPSRKSSGKAYSPPPAPFDGMMQSVHSDSSSLDEVVPWEKQKLPSLNELNNNKANIHAVFDKFDKNGDGLLSAEELVVAWRETLKTDLTVKEAEKMIEQADHEGKGAVTRGEFIQMCQTI